MGVLDVLGFICIAIGLTLAWLGHHYLGPLFFWGSMLPLLVGLTLIGTSARRRRDIDKALREHRGPGDFGDRHYHSGHGGGDSFGGGGADGD